MLPNPSVNRDAHPLRGLPLVLAHGLKAMLYLIPCEL
jgi:hypothetical protein